MLRYLSALLLAAMALALALGVHPRSQAQMLLTGAGTGGLWSNTYGPLGVNFGSSVYGSKAAALNGGAASASGVVSFWWNNNNATGAQHTVFTIYTSTTLYFGVYIGTTTANMNIVGINSGGTTVLQAGTTSGYASQGTTWHHMLYSWNLAATPRCQQYVDNVADQACSTFTASQTVNWAGTGTHYVGSTQPGNSALLLGNVADMQIWTGLDLDISVAANRQNNFIDGSNKAVDPAIAQTNLGQPLIGFYGSQTNNWVQSQHGSGGNFTVVSGTLAAAGTNPP